ncbi:uncharacterized protein LOC111406472 [Olea europaea var. sylvestris]|uniref:uncharacterized protein LOC111406472 n=1 Tax=Olea europaea var. sylvestris TaxID=158386 RepID=UPI000C1D0328|nr:uncharacterized protein LOC111406472 [Olea europaea var. sylvestris]
MVSTRRSGSLPSNNNNNNNKNKKSSPAESSSPKRQKGESSNCNGSNSKASEKSTPPAENPKENSSTDLPELPVAAASVSDVTPIVAEGTKPVIADKIKSSTTSCKQRQGQETTWPWCRLLSEFPKNPSVSVCTTIFSVGSSKRANLSIRDQTVSAILCFIRLTQHEGKVVGERDWIQDSILASRAGKSLRKSAFREDIIAAILEGGSLEVSFDNFPYYLSESTKNVLIAASYVHLKHKDQVKYASELSNLNPRILLSGPAGLFPLRYFSQYH